MQVETRYRARSFSDSLKDRNVEEESDSRNGRDKLVAHRVSAHVHRVPNKGARTQTITPTTMSDASDDEFGMSPSSFSAVSRTSEYG